ncbi:MAG: FitA-like ribbon-helix-helix domain-containing protein [Acetobacteraceae bacterium]
MKNAPDDVVERLRQRAQRNHRSLQGELMAIIEEAVRPARQQPRELSEDQQAFVVERPRALTVHEVLARARTLGLPVVNEAAELVRADRDRGHRGGG